MQQATKQPAVLLVHDYYQVPGGEDVVVANEKHLLETHGHAAALYVRRNEEISRMERWRKSAVRWGCFSASVHAARFDGASAKTGFRWCMCTTRCR